MMKQSSYEKSAHLYDLFDDKDNIDFFSYYGKQSEEILDIGAGTGRIAIPLARKGVEVYCVEPSPAMRFEFERKLRGEKDIQNMIVFIEGDASNFDVDGQFPCAYLSGTFDHFLTDEERVASLTNIKKHLLVDGVLIFDLFIGMVDNSTLKPAGFVRIDGWEYQRSVSRTVVEDDIVEVKLLYEIYHHGELKEKVEETGLVGIIDRESVRSLLSETGYEVVKEYGDYDFTPFEEGDELLIIEAASS